MLLSNRAGLGSLRSCRGPLADDHRRAAELLDEPGAVGVGAPGARVGRASAFRGAEGGLFAR